MWRKISCPLLSVKFYNFYKISLLQNCFYPHFLIQWHSTNRVTFDAKFRQTIKILFWSSGEFYGSHKFCLLLIIVMSIFVKVLSYDFVQFQQQYISIQCDQKENKPKQALQIIGHIVAEFCVNKRSMRGRRQFVISNATL
jgi:hypothetical protein